MTNYRMEMEHRNSASAEKVKNPRMGTNAVYHLQDEKDKSLEKGYTNMGFQPKELVLAISAREVSTKQKEAGDTPDTGGGGAHGIPVEHPTSYAETLMHLLKGNVGSGIFAMGDAYKNAGLLLAPGVVIFLGIICIHCMHLLLTVSKRLANNLKLERYPDFATTVELSFATGPKPMKTIAPAMRKLVNLFLCVTQLGFCCVYFVFIATNIKQVFDQYNLFLDVHLHMLIILLPILLSCLVRNLKFLAPLSAFANLLMLIGIIITLYYTTQDLPPISSRTYVANWNQLPLFFGTALYAFEGIGLVLPLQTEMKKPKNFQRPLGVLNVGMSIVVILYTVVGFLAYLKYGADIMGSVTLNLPKEEVLAQSVKIIISLAILFTYALQFYIPMDIMWPSIVKSSGPFKYPVLMECCFRTVFVLLTFVLAEAIPYLGLFISLVGAVSSTALALIFPPLLDLVISWSVSETTPWKVFKNIVILTVGIVGCITGTYESIHAIVKAFSESS